MKPTQEELIGLSDSLFVCPSKAQTAIIKLFVYIEEQEKKVKELEDMLKGLEWAGTQLNYSSCNGESVCPECLGLAREMVHAPKCKLNALLQNIVK